MRVEKMPTDIGGTFFFLMPLAGGTDSERVRLQRLAHKQGTDAGQLSFWRREPPFGGGSGGGCKGSPGRCVSDWALDRV